MAGDHRPRFGEDCSNDSILSQPARITQFNADELKTIGMQCANRLPPASAVQAMFLYEMQRQTDCERLFQGEMFRLARGEERVFNQDARIRALEEQMHKAQKQDAVQDLDKKLSARRVQMDRLTGKVAGHDAALTDLEKRVESIDERAKRQTYDARVPSKNDAFANALVSAELQDIKGELDILFDERDGLISLIDELKETMQCQREEQILYNKQVADKVNKLDDLFKRYTLDGSLSTTATNGCASPSSSLGRAERASPVQLIPVTTSDGSQLDLSVPKGSPLVALKENRPMRTFVPGQKTHGED